MYASSLRVAHGVPPNLGRLRPTNSVIVRAGCGTSRNENSDEKNDFDSFFLLVNFGQPRADDDGSSFLRYDVFLTLPAKNFDGERYSAVLTKNFFVLWLAFLIGVIRSGALGIENHEEDVDVFDVLRNFGLADFAANGFSLLSDHGSTASAETEDSATIAQATNSFRVIVTVDHSTTRVLGKRGARDPGDSSQDNRRRDGKSGRTLAECGRQVQSGCRKPMQPALVAGPPDRTNPQARSSGERIAAGIGEPPALAG